MKTHATWFLAAMIAAGAGGGACASDGNDNEAGQIAAALEEENGGLDTADEAPLFGDEALFEEADLTTADPVSDDPMATDPATAGMMSAPDAMLYGVAVVWGQIPGNRANTVARDWSGSFSVSRGAMVVRRLIAFERPGDGLAPRTDRQVVSFRSHTLPHHDGLVLAVVDPTPEAGTPIVLTYTGNDGTSLDIPVRALLDGPVDHAFDDADNRMIATAVARPVDACEHGFLRGRWHRVAEGRGKLLGRVVNADGEPIGHIRGVYGKKLDGSRVFFGKYIDLDGRFRGIFRGTYGDNRFEGHWLTKAGETGLLGGAYRETIPGPEVGGHFIGRWAETSCERLPDPSAP